MTRQTTIVNWSPADREVYLSVTEFYGGDHPRFWTERLSFAMDDNDEGIEVAVDVTERDLWLLGTQFLAAYGTMRDQRRAHEGSEETPAEPETTVLPWDHRWVDRYDHENGEVLAALFGEGWEPFAAEHQPGGVSRLHLRRRAGRLR